ncbi:hypothetical protein [Rhodopseudomonas telluris]|uniref:Bacteriophage lambda Replication protein O N-terminal domain-containing protein n=1 Tax=Rhodopseudomonas telluris TaxID=644215 RepID=A0ABV6EZB2_9BRAD
MFKKYKHHNDNHEAVIKSPDGIDIKITPGAKWKFTRAVMRDQTLSDLQKLVLILLIDKTNEGFGKNPEMFGYAYLGVKAIAKEVGKRDERSVKRVLRELRTGEIIDQKTMEVRETRKIWLTVMGDGKGGRSAVNRYWLKDWNKFGAVAPAPDDGDMEDSEAARKVASAQRKGDIDARQRVTSMRLKVTSTQRDSDTMPPDSSQDTPLQHTSKEYTQENSPQQRDRAEYWPDNAWDQFWDLFPNKTAKKIAEASFNKVSEAGSVEFADLMEGLRLYVNKDDFREWCMPSTWLDQGRWEDRPKQKQKIDLMKDYRSRMKYAI